jgi:hypothetical protein
MHRLEAARDTAASRFAAVRTGGCACGEWGSRSQSFGKQCGASARRVGL